MSSEVLEMYKNEAVGVLEHREVQDDRLARLLALCGSISDDDAAIMLEASRECRQDYGEW